MQQAIWYCFCNEFQYNQNFLYLKDLDLYFLKIR